MISHDQCRVRFLGLGYSISGLVLGLGLGFSVMNINDANLPY